MRNPAGLLLIMKLAKAFNEQINILKSRGLIVDDEKQAVKFLARVNYYRFSGYAKLFYASKDSFKERVKFSDIISAYYFDCELRNLLNEIMADIEISLRTQIAYNLAINVSPICYSDSSIFENENEHKEMMETIAKERARKIKIQW